MSINWELGEIVKRDLERAWTLPDASKIIAAHRKIIYETIGEGWEYNLWYKKIEDALNEWEALSNPEELPPGMAYGLRFQTNLMVEDIEWELKFQAGGGDEMAKAHAFGYDI